jgi:mevalonate kinase
MQSIDRMVFAGCNSVVLGRSVKVILLNEFKKSYIFASVQQSNPSCLDIFVCMVDGVVLLCTYCNP